jgi:hypothetical protein
MTIAVWTRKWMEALSWRDVQKYLRAFRQIPLETMTSIQISRYKRLQAEWERRQAKRKKREAREGEG